MSLLWSSEYFMLMDLLTYRFSTAKYRFKSFLPDQYGQAPQARGAACMKQFFVTCFNTYEILHKMLQRNSFFRKELRCSLTHKAAC